MNKILFTMLVLVGASMSAKLMADSTVQLEDLTLTQEIADQGQIEVAALTSDDVDAGVSSIFGHGHHHHHHHHHHHIFHHHHHGDHGHGGHDHGHGGHGDHGHGHGSQADGSGELPQPQVELQ